MRKVTELYSDLRQVHKRLEADLRGAHFRSERAESHYEDPAITLNEAAAPRFDDAPRTHRPNKAPQLTVESEHNLSDDDNDKRRERLNGLQDVDFTGRLHGSSAAAQSIDAETGRLRTPVAVDTMFNLAKHQLDPSRNGKRANVSRNPRRRHSGDDLANAQQRLAPQEGHSAAALISRVRRR